MKRYFKINRLLYLSIKSDKIEGDIIGAVKGIASSFIDEDIFEVEEITKEKYDNET